MITIFVGDCTEHLSESTRKLYPDARLINNYSILNNGVYYVSLGDINDLHEFNKILAQGDRLIYCPPEIWSDTDKNNHSGMKLWTEFYLAYHRDKTEVQNLNSLYPYNLSTMLELVDQRKTNDNQIWNVGCSITRGIGVDKTQRYGQLIADSLGMPISFLAVSGSSINWAADQILRSDIKSNDLVIWGLTEFKRFDYFDQKLHHVNSQYYYLNPEFNNVVNIDQLNNENRIYQSITKILQVSNFCKKINAKLVIAGLLVQDDFINYTLQLPNYVQLYGNFGKNDNPYINAGDGYENGPYLDIGTDKSHPGPLMHKWYAEHILRKINEL